MKIYRFDGESSALLAEASLKAVTFPDNKRKALSLKKVKMKRSFPALKIHIPKNYRLVHHLFVGPGDNIWVYVYGSEFKGFKVFSSNGKFLADVKIDKELSKKDKVINPHKGSLYVMETPPKKGLTLWRYPLPKMK